MIGAEQEAPQMRHALVGAGGIGGLLGAALARTGADVVVLMRAETAARYGGRLMVESAVLGDFDVSVPAATVLEGHVDVLWVTTKAMHLEPALALAPAEIVGDGIVIPLLNGVDHVELLRARYRNVVPGTIRVESERIDTGRIRQSTPFVRVELAGAAAVAAELSGAGIECRVRDDELSMLWEKLVFLAPVALATTALDGPLGVIRDVRATGLARTRCSRSPARSGRRSTKPLCASSRGLLQTRCAARCRRTSPPVASLNWMRLQGRSCGAADATGFQSVRQPISRLSSPLRPGSSCELVPTISRGI
jgi:ketopantoate reductase